VPWLAGAAALLRANRAGAGVLIGDVTMGVDHYAVQAALALALPTMALLASVWPRGRRALGVAAGGAAAYLGLVSAVFPGTPAGLGPAWSIACLAWGVSVGALAIAAARLQRGELGREVVEAQ
jgi:hypothetical protein